jgi:hypothetical protein
MSSAGSAKKKSTVRSIGVDSSGGKAFLTSSAVTRPPRPVGRMLDISKPYSRASILASEDAGGPFLILLFLLLALQILTFRLKFCSRLSG